MKADEKGCADNPLHNGVIDLYERRARDFDRDRSRALPETGGSR